MKAKVKVCLFKRACFFLCHCGLTVEGRASHDTDPTEDSGFLTWHNTWLTELLLRFKGAIVSRLSVLHGGFLQI